MFVYLKSVRATPSFATSNDRLRLLVIVPIILVALFVSGAVGAENTGLPGTFIGTKCFKRAGHLKFRYGPGVFVPLRNGKILALFGCQYQMEMTSVPKTFVGVDGTSYGFSNGMVELFDPQTGESQILTKLPFSFPSLPSDEDSKEMKAIELKDGRIFMVGRFVENRHNPPAQSNVSITIPEWLTPGPPWRSFQPPTDPLAFGLLYDPKDNKCEIIRTTPDVPPRCETTMYALPNGKALIIGGTIDFKAPTIDGYTRYPEKRVLEFDPDTKKLTIVGELLRPRFGHAMVPLSDTEFMLIGGDGAPEKEILLLNGKSPPGVREVEIFDLKAGTSRVVGQTLTRRADFSAVPFPNGKILITGGLCRGSLSYFESELYDPKTGRSSYVGQRMPNGLLCASCDKVPYRMPGEGVSSRSGLKGNYLLLVGPGGGFIHDYREITSEAPLDPLHEISCVPYVRRVGSELVTTIDGRLLLIGGKILSSDKGADLVEEFVYDGEDQNYEKKK